MPYKSDAQRKFFNANKRRLVREGVDVEEWNDVSEGMRLPKRISKKKH